MVRAAGIGVAVFVACNATAAGRLLDDAAWREDVTAVASAIREYHPRPFRSVSAEEFQRQYEALLADIPTLTDKGVIVRLAALVGLVADGHTRLAIPRQHPELGLEFGHTATAAPAYPGLAFRQLPVRFERLADGLFIVAAREDLADLIGYRLVAIDDTPAEDALARVRAITFAENSQLAALMGADRLSLPEALELLGVVRTADAVTLQLADGNGNRVQRLTEPMSAEPVAWREAQGSGPLPLRLQEPGAKFWSRHVDDGNFVYVQLNEIADDGDVSLAGFVTAAIRTATERDAKLIIDLRNNFGGSGGLNKTLVMSIIGSDELNRYDRTFVLTGPRTFSAAQMLVNELEQYTRVTFVGEATGSRPDHFGDPQKIRLANSGLTLRVSRLHWSSYTAFDERESTQPDFSVPWTADAWFEGRDPALEFAVSLREVGLKSLLRGALPRGDLVQIGRYLLDSKTAPDTFADDFSGTLLALAEEFETSGDPETAKFTCEVGLFFYPGNRALVERLEALDAT